MNPRKRLLFAGALFFGLIVFSVIGLPRPRRP
jgi:hypothetical protein